MKKFGDAVDSKNGFVLYPLFEIRDDGTSVMVCYVIVDAEGKVVNYYQSFEEAKKALEEMGNDEQPDSFFAPKKPRI